ncbi:hypothetical protein D1970_03305 [Mesobacillus zeae]|uniref:Uncharacterized protein n=1 Tax=Mesobacillus zeae TaxID=1917180 RepID=A0A398BKD1_9BACI|nr:hypothetical protein D1970_03305 [Mesobacillus zeae]
MVTAILIPAICIYFYWVTKKEMKRHDEQWSALQNIPEESSVSGNVLDAYWSREKYYLHRYNHVLTLKVRSGCQIILAKKITPLKEGVSITPVNKGDNLRLFGKWQEDFFQVNRILYEDKNRTD